MARPRKQVDEEKLFKLASLGLTTAEIASVLECSPDTLERNYKEEMAEGKEMCKASIRRKQFELAMAGNPTMLIWLGKQVLGQKDQLRLGSDPNEPLKVEHDASELVSKIIGATRKKPDDDGK